MSIPSPYAALVAYLRDTTAVTDLSGLTRIATPSLPARINSEMPRQAVVVRASGGFGAIGRGFQNYGDVRIDTRCYGRSEVEADAMHWAVHEALQQLRRKVYAETLMHWAAKAGGPVATREPDTEWPVVFASWQLFTSEVRVA